MEPKISVIIPVYNGAKFLPRSISSVINQTHKNWELVIVDDGSTDNSKEVVSEYVKKDSRIQYYSQPNSGTPAKPKNTAMKYVQGEYVAYLDQDDEWLPEKLEKQLAVFKKYPNEKIGLVGCEAYIVDEKGLFLGISPTVKKNAGLADLLAYDYIFSNSSVMLPAVVVKEIGGRDESAGIDYAEDWDMWVRVMARGYFFRFAEDLLFNYTIHANNVSGDTNQLKLADINEAFYNKHKKLYKDNNAEQIILERIALGYSIAGKKQKARKYYKKVAEITGPSIKNYAYIALIYLGVDITKFIIRIWNTLFQKENLPMYLNRLKFADASVVFYNKYKYLYEKNNNEHVFLKTIGIYYALSGYNEKAREYYNKSVRAKSTYMSPKIYIIFTYFGTKTTRIIFKILKYPMKIIT